MKELKCSDLGERTCNYISQGKSTEQVERNMLDHVEQQHSFFIEPLDLEERERLMRQMDAMIKDK
jgi:predicted small metal-binding protein